MFHITEDFRYEMEQWLAVRKRMNEVSWYDPAHHSIAITGAIDASSQAWGGVVRSPPVFAKVFCVAADFLHSAEHQDSTQIKICRMSRGFE